MAAISCIWHVAYMYNESALMLPRTVADDEDDNNDEGFGAKATSFWGGGSMHEKSMCMWLCIIFLRFTEGLEAEGELFWVVLGFLGSCRQGMQ
jgi:hypothetical protein